MNAVYGFYHLWKTILFCALKGRYLENGVKRLDEKGAFAVPDADTVYARLKRKEIDEILGEFLAIQRNIIRWLRKARKIPWNVTVLIDEHDVPWYGDDAPYLVSTRKCDGTSLCFRYISINAVLGSQRICLYMLPVTSFSRKDELVDKLLDVVTRYFRIRLVMFDRGFSQDSTVLKVVEERGLRYLAPLPKNHKIKQLIEDTDTDQREAWYHTGYAYGRAGISLNLFFTPNGKNMAERWKNYHVFCTNIDLADADISCLADVYRGRWNIENFYRDGEGHFMINTKTGEPQVRLFFFTVAATLYNLWYLVRRLVMVIAQRWKDHLIDLLECKRRLGYTQRYGTKIGEELMQMCTA
ncbi:MAG: transposase [Thermoplasmatota archaeon]